MVVSSVSLGCLFVFCFSGASWNISLCLYGVSGGVFCLSLNSLLVFFVVSWMSLCFLWVVLRVSLGSLWECFMSVSSSVSVVFWGVFFFYFYLFIFVCVYFGVSEMYFWFIFGVFGGVSVVSFECL